MKARARPPRSTCGQPIWPTWGWPAPRICPSSWSATSTAAGCWPTCSGRSRCSNPTTSAHLRDSWSTSSAATPPCWHRGWPSCETLTGRPTYGVIPYTDGLWLDTEDSVSVLAHRVVGDPQPPRGDEWLRVAAIRLPRISNSTDVEALACEPGVLVRWVTDPADLADADVVVIPGSKATVADLALAARPRPGRRHRRARRRTGKPVLGICGGFQMLCRRIDDPVESGAGGVDGLGLLDADIVFAPDKTLRQHEAAVARLRDPSRPTRPLRRGRLARCRNPAWHGLRHALARPVRQQRTSATMAHRNGPRPGSSSPTTSTSRRGATPNST